MKIPTVKIPQLNKQSSYIIIFIIVFFALGSAIFFYGKYKEEYNKARQIIGGENTQQAKEVIAKIGKLMELPTGEEPTLATVSDITKLEGQPFFSRAKNGDKVLIYTKIQKAILYRPSTDKIIEVATINLKQDEPQAQAEAPAPNTKTSPAPSPSSTPTPTKTKSIGVILWNGTKTIGLTKTAESLLKENVAGIEIVDKDNAGSSDYEKTITIDLSGGNKTLADKIAKEVGGTVASLPKTETKPETGDILVILGKDYK